MFYRTREASLVPESKTVWGYATARFFNGLLFREAHLKKPTTDYNRLSRAAYYMENDQLFEATREIEQLSSPLCREVSESWLSEARNRLVVEQAVSLINAYVGLLPSQYEQVHIIPTLQ